jgi:hypothetical protein
MSLQKLHAQLSQGIDRKRRKMQLFFKVQQLVSLQKLHAQLSQRIDRKRHIKRTGMTRNRIEMRETISATF